jgi:hypothetical protein
MLAIRPISWILDTKGFRGAWDNHPGELREIASQPRAERSRPAVFKCRAIFRQLISFSHSFTALSRGNFRRGQPQRLPFWSDTPGCDP